MSGFTLGLQFVVFFQMPWFELSAGRIKAGENGAISSRNIFYASVAEEMADVDFR